MRQILYVMFMILFILPNVSANDSDIDGDGINNDVDNDIDGDGFNNSEDDCPWIHGDSRLIQSGCPDMDGDFVPDIYDDDADGDGIRNEMERAASTGIKLYDPYNSESTPSDVDEDTIPDVLDDDADNDGILNEYEMAAKRITGIDYDWRNASSTPPDFDEDGVPDAVDEDSDNDGWPDRVEIDRGSNHLDSSENPHNMYMGIDSGFFYLGGFSFQDEYDAESIEISLSGTLDIVTEELVIPLLLVPLYIMAYVARKRQYLLLMDEIENTTEASELSLIEKRTNQMVKSRRIKVYHGLVLRNAIEEKEVQLGSENLSLENSWVTSIEEE